MKKIEGLEQEVQQEVQPTEMIMALYLAQGVLDYLASRPYNEVSELIKGIQGSKLQ
tara:strand:+ start:801 stop:968 length:168 start_codon:yes stop_codon:yes gene_type:complete